MMRKIKTIILAFVMIMTMQTMAYGQEKGSDRMERVMNAIIQVESGGNPKAHNPKGDCVGILQITKVCVKDINEYLAIKGSSKRFTLNDRYNAEKSKEMFMLYQKRHNPEGNVEKAIRIWNGGPYYYKGKAGKTDGYYRKVMKYYK